MTFGDSLTSSGAKSHWDKFALIFPNTTITFIGTQNSGFDWKHEGQPGATYKWLATDPASRMTKAGVLDVPAYFTDNGLATPDFISMACGINESVSAKVAGFTRATMDEYLGYLNEFLDAFLAYDANVKLIIRLPAISENTGAGWENNYPGDLYQDTYIANIHYIWKELLTKYGSNKYDARVFVSTGPYILDRDDGYPKVDGVHTNGVHPNTAGYYDLADGLAGVINSLR
jgi:hypothetical protein